jgi:ATP phosphoribosyltransferase
MRFCIIGKASKQQKYTEMLKSNKNIIVATSYPEQAKAYFARNYPNFQSEFLDFLNLGGEVELGVKTDRADIGFEIVESGNSLRRNKLIEYNTAYPIPVCLIANKAALELDDRVAELSKNISGGALQL